MKLTKPFNYPLLNLLFVLLIMYSCKNEANLPDPTDEQLTELATNLSEAFKDSRAIKGKALDTTYKQKMQVLVDSAISKFSFDNLTLKQIEDNFLSTHVIKNSPALFDIIYPRLETISKYKNLEGALAASYAISLAPSRPKNDRFLPIDQRAFEEKYNLLINHPAIDSLLLSEHSISIKILDNFFRHDSIAFSNNVMLNQMQELLKKPMSYNFASNLKALYDGINQSGYADKTITEQIRVECIDALNKTLNRIEDLSENQITLLNEHIERLDGPYSKNELINYPAPEFNFVWSNTGNINSLADYKGKVLILDFWATWCGPCRLSFPNVNQIVDYYKGYPVEMLGITSVQGGHYNPITRETINLSGDLDKEFELVLEFMKDTNMNWNIAYSDRNVYDTQYGVDGIPHVVIIDPNGIVRYNGLNPVDGSYDKAIKINDILKEFNLPYPKEEPSKENLVKFDIPKDFKIPPKI